MLLLGSGVIKQHKSQAQTLNKSFSEHNWHTAHD